MDKYQFGGVSCMPMGNAEFILAINATMRKATKKQAGDTVMLKIELDTSPVVLNEDLMLCLEEEPQAKEFFMRLKPGHQRYFSNWVQDAKTPETKAKRILMTLKAMLLQQNYSEMIRAQHAKNQALKMSSQF